MSKRKKDPEKIWQPAPTVGQYVPPPPYLTEAKREILDIVATKVAQGRAAVQHSPLLLLDGDPADMEHILDRVRLGGMRCVEEAIQRGQFTFNDIEKITAALIVMGLHPKADRRVLQTSNVVGAHLERLTKLIAARENVEVNQETAFRIKAIESALGEMVKE